jgi:hypothetical protein
MCEDFAPNFGDKRTGCCITTTYHLTLPFSPWTKNNITVALHSPDLDPCNFSPFPRSKMKLKGRGFDTIEVIKAESQAVLNTITKHNFQDAF